MSGLRSPEETWKYAGSPTRRRAGEDRHDRGHDVVDRHDVDDRVGGGRELGQLAAAVGQDQRLGHLEALDPAHVRPLEGGLDDARTHDGHGVLARMLLHDPLAQRLGEGVAVGPAEAARPLGADPHQLVLDPLLARGLRGRGRGQQTGPAVLLLGALALGDEYVGAAGPVLDRLALGQPPAQLGLEVGVVRHRTLGDAAPAAPGDVRGGDVDVVDVRPDLADPRQQLAGADDVGAEPLVDGRVEADVAGAVHDRVQVVGQGRRAGEVALDHAHPGVHQLVEATCRSRRSSVKIGFPSSERTRWLGRGGPLGPHQQRHVDAGHLTEQQVQQRLTDETRGPREQDPLPVEPLGDADAVRHVVSSRSVPHDGDSARWLARAAQRSPVGATGIEPVTSSL